MAGKEQVITSRVCNYGSHEEFIFASLAGALTGGRVVTSGWPGASTTNVELLQMLLIQHFEETVIDIF